MAMNLCNGCKHLVDVPNDEGLKTCDLGLHKDYKHVADCPEFEEKSVIIDSLKNLFRK